MQLRHASQLWCLGLLLASVLPSHAADRPLDVDPGPWMGAQAEPVATRARWLFRPNDAALARARLAEGDVELVATLPRFDDLWILESAFDDIDRVEADWASQGTLQRDRTGTPCLVRTTALVGVRPSVWDDLELRGDMASTIAILDSGCDTAHDDLGDVDLDNFDAPPFNAGDLDDWSDAVPDGFAPEPKLRVVGWHDVSDDVVSSQGPYDYHRHGTALAGVAVGGGHLDAAQQGVAPEGRLVIVKTYNFEGRWEIWASDLLLGIDWLLQHVDDYRVHACLIGANWDEELEISAAVDALLDAGVAVVAAAGNDPTQPMGYPARLDGVITVGATDAEGLLSAYSTPGELGTLVPDIVAPGGGSNPLTGPIVTCDNEPNDTYRGRVGTSIAAAHVAGAISIVSQAMAESGRPWRADRAQVEWVEDLLRVTAVEIAGAEPGAPVLPSLSRGGHDRAEGFGLVQVDAAVNAIRRVLWPGEQRQIQLGSPLTGVAVWAARMPVMGRYPIELDLSVPGSSDFDLYVLRDHPDGLEYVASSQRRGGGDDELIRMDYPVPGTYIVVVKRVGGDGSATLDTTLEYLGSSHWPLDLSGRSVSSPAVVDLDGDGRLEIVATSNVSIDDSGHTITVARANGSVFAPFPRTFFTGVNERGPLTAPAIGDLGSGPWIVTGSSFGWVYAMDLNGVLRIQTAVAVNGTATTAPALWMGSTPARIVVGTSTGASILDASGAVVDQWILGAAAVAPPALGDLDGDGEDEVVLSTADGKIHAREIGGALVSGWPVIRNPGVALSGPTVWGADGGAATVLLSELAADGTARVLALNGSGASRAGFPASLDPSDGLYLALADAIPSRLELAGVPQVLVACLRQDADGGVGARLHRFGLDGVETVGETMRLTTQAFAGTNFELLRVNLAAATVGDLISASGAEVLISLQLAWREVDGIFPRRYGSVQRHFVSSVDGLDPRLVFDTADAHPWDERDEEPLPTVSYRIPALVADLDGDLFAELLVVRENRIHLMGGYQPTQPRAYWSAQALDALRSQCYACAPPIAVATPEVEISTALRLSSSPNPFNPRTQLALDVPAGGTSHWSVIDARGRRVRSWTRELDGPGYYREIFDGADDSGRALASGVYRVLVEVGGEAVSHSLTLLR